MIYVVGIGPGNFESMTPEAVNALNLCYIIAGYEKYIELVKKFFPDKIFFVNSMRHEIERCEKCLWFAKKYPDKNIALISSGDAGIYGMAGLMLEVASGSGVEVKIIPGITAANSAAAILGAPLMNDFVIISLSDLMTSWAIIKSRLVAACEGDFVICIYNPASKHRPENFKMACEILLRYKDPDTPAGYVRNIGRDGEEYEIMTLEKIMSCEKIDMLCTVIIGNSKSYVLDGKIITPRGYEQKEKER